jgi:hypothetical protein
MLINAGIYVDKGAGWACLKRVTPIIILSIHFHDSGRWIFYKISFIPIYFLKMRVFFSGKSTVK